MSRRYSIELMLLAGGVVAYRCTDIQYRRQVLSGAEPSTQDAIATCNRQLALVKQGCEGAWDIEVEVQPAVQA